ncbi:hypothetical protein [Sphaerotilus sp.]|uniref:hypothetical protein n=1 Tax=Sphaerotilus sp. TaxID=2093942 RepID=UPI00286E049F|nr:hypothetical protein [Sphaerotilus sp.]
MWMRNGVRAASLAVLVAATTGCCVLSPVLSVCAPGGFEGRGGGGRGGGHGGGHGGGRHHLLGAAPQPVSSLAVVASVETQALASMYVASDADASPVGR